MDLKPLNIGIIGCSSIAERTMLPAIADHKDFSLKAVGSRSSEKADSFATIFDCSATTYDGILLDDSIDAVYISLPASLHFEWGLRTVEAGKHLLLEKPFTDSLENSKKLIDTAKSNHRIAMESLTYVYHPLFAELSRLIAHGEIGSVRHIESAFGFPFLPESDIRNFKDLGGGATLDNLIYPLSFCLNLIKNDYQSFSYNIIRDTTKDIDTRGFLRIDWDDLSADITYGFGFSYRNTLTVWGDKGMLSVDRAFTRPSNMPGEILIKKESGECETLEILPANQFAHLLTGFYEKISGIDSSGINEGKDILARMKIISTMYENQTG